MDFDGRLRFPEVGPRKQRQTQTDYGGIERVDGSVQIQSEIVVGIQAACGSDQRLGKLGIDSPISAFVCIGKVGGSDVATQTHMVKLGRLGLKASDDIPQALPVGQLGEGHAQKLIPTPKRSRDDVSVALADQLSTGMRGCNSISWAKTSFPAYIGFPQANPESVGQVAAGVQVGDTPENVLLRAVSVSYGGETLNVSDTSDQAI